MSDQPFFSEGSPEQLDEIIARKSRAARRYRADDREGFVEEVRGRARVKAVEKLPNVKDLRSLDAWVTTMVGTTSTDLWREQQRRRRREVSLDEKLALSFDPPTSELSPEEASIRSEQMNAIRTVMGRLKDPRAAVILEMKQEEWTTAEIAAELGLSPGNVAQIQSRALKALREFLEPLSAPTRGSPRSSQRGSLLAGLRRLRMSYPVRRERHWLM